MNTLCATLLLALACLTLTAHAQTFQWVRASSSNGFDSEVTGVAYGTGHVTAVGSFAGSLSFGGQTIITAGGPTSTSISALTAQWSSAGALSWLSWSGTVSAQARTNGAIGKAAATDAAGNLYVEYVTGTGDALFGTVTLHTAAAVAVVLVKYDLTGNIIWLKTFTCSDGIEPGGLTVDAAGTCWLAASFIGQVVVGADTLLSSQQLPNRFDGLLLKLDSSGNVLWHQQVPTSRGTVFNAISTDAASNVYAVGALFTAIQFGPGVSLQANGRRLFVAKFDANGTALWARSMGGQDFDFARGVAVDATGAIAVCGTFGQKSTGFTVPPTATFGAFTLTADGRDGYTDAFITKLNPQGSFLWAQSIHGLGDEQANAIVTGGQGEFYVSGEATYGSSAGPFSITTGNGGGDGFVAKFTSAGAPQWITGYGGPDDDYFAGAALATDKQGHLYVGGSFLGSAYFTTVSAVSSPGRYAAFVAQLTDDQVVLGTQPARPAPVALQVYPNPAHGSVQVEWPAAARPTTLEILDLVGRTVLKTVVSPGLTRQTLPLNNLRRGLYIVKASGETPNSFIAQRLLVE